VHDSMEILDPESSLVVQTLVETYGFGLEQSVSAVAAVGRPVELNAAIDWLFSQGEEDRGGAVAFVHCEHLDDDGVALVSPSQLRYGSMCAAGCNTNECWVCLFCGETNCSRYVKKHALAHHEVTRSASNPLGHHVAMSLSDLSTWSFESNSYVQHPRLAPLVAHMQTLKFGDSSATTAALDTTAPGAGTAAPGIAAPDITSAEASRSKAAGKRVAAQPLNREHLDDDD